MSRRLPTLLAALFLVSLSLFLTPSWAFDIEDETNSLMLTELNFSDGIKEKKYVLVNFHALWCRYSKKLKPEWKALSDAVRDREDFALAKVEAYDEKKVAEQYGVEGYPTIKLFIDQKPHDYNGERDHTSILEFVDRKMKRDLKTVDTVSQVEDYLKTYEWVGILVGTDNQDVVKDVAFNTGDVLFVSTTKDDVKNKYNVGSDGKFVLVNNVSGGSSVSKDALTIDSLTKFIEDNKFPSIAKFSKGTAERVFLSEDPSLILLRKADENGNTAEQAFKDANKNLGSKIFMSVANYGDEIGKLLVENLGVDESDLPAVVIVRADKERIRKYILGKSDFKGTDVEAFYQNFLDKKATRLYLSEPIPAENNDLVYKVVTKEFQKIVLDDNKDVLLHIWAPWCGHCRAMMPVYDNVARKTRDVENFVVAKIDASVNDLEGFGLDIVEYPTILLFKKGDKKNPVEFKDERNEYKFNDFIRANAAVNLDRMKGPNPFDKNEL